MEYGMCPTIIYRSHDCLSIHVRTQQQHICFTLNDADSGEKKIHCENGEGFIKIDVTRPKNRHGFRTHIVGDWSKEKLRENLLLDQVTHRSVEMNLHANKHIEARK
jgi:hypothetical protein